MKRGVSAGRTRVWPCALGGILAMHSPKHLTNCLARRIDEAELASEYCESFFFQSLRTFCNGSPADLHNRASIRASTVCRQSHGVRHREDIAQE